MKNETKKTCLAFHPYREKMRIMSFNTQGVTKDADERFPYIIESILLYLPDILGIQEAGKKIHANVIEKINNYYAVACDMHENGPVNYTPILYRMDKFNVVDAGVEWLDSRYTGTNTKSVSWAVFKCKCDNSGMQVGVVNMHGAVLSNKYIGYEETTREERHEVCTVWRVDNVRQMLGIKDRLIDEFGDMPFILMGDFNCGSDSEAYKAMINAKLCEAETTASDLFSSGKQTIHEIGQLPIDGISIDHIFGTSDIIFDLYGVGNTAHDLLSSDHCPIFTDVSIEISQTSIKESTTKEKI